MSKGEQELPLSAGVPVVVSADVHAFLERAAAVWQVSTPGFIDILLDNVRGQLSTRRFGKFADALRHREAVWFETAALEEVREIARESLSREEYLRMSEPQWLLHCARMFRSNTRPLPAVAAGGELLPGQAVALLQKAENMEQQVVQIQGVIARKAREMEELKAENSRLREELARFREFPGKARDSDAGLLEMGLEMVQSMVEQMLRGYHSRKCKK